MSREITILTPENVELRFELAGIGSRFIALFVDTFWQTLFTAIPVLVFIAVAYTAHTINLSEVLGMFSPWVIAIFTLFLFSLWTGYFLYYEASRNGQTPGKKQVGIKVILDTGHPVDFRGAILRNLMRAVDSLPGTYAVAIISSFVSPQYRRLGDYVAGTLVVKVPKEDWMTPAQRAAVAPNVADPAESDTSAVPPSLLPDEVLANLHLVTRDDYRAVRHFLDRRRELQENVAVVLADKLAQPLAARLNAHPSIAANPVRFLESVAAEWERRMVH